MNEHDVVDGSEQENPPKPSYWVWFVNEGGWVLPIMFVMFIPWYLFYRPIEVTRGPWQVLDPGKPVENPLKFEVVQEGEGTVVEPGDLIMISLQWWSSDREKTGDQGEWWIWAGFRTKNETDFYSINPRLVSVFVGQKEGGKLRIATNGREDLHLNPFGSSSSYRFGKGARAHKWTSITSTNDVYIKKVFKGQLKYQTIRLYDDTWYHHCYNFLSCEYTNTPRKFFHSEARYEGVSVDGKLVTFQYGPEYLSVDPWLRENRDKQLDKELEGMQVERFYGNQGNWYHKEWNKLPVGVQVE
jgi:hypothetical protein